MSKITSKSKKGLFSDISNFVLIKEKKKTVFAKLPTIAEQTIDTKRIVKSKIKEEYSLSAVNIPNFPKASKLRSAKNRETDEKREKKIITAKSPATIQQTNESKKIEKFKKNEKKNEKEDEKKSIPLISHIKQEIISENDQNELLSPTIQLMSKKTETQNKSVFADISNFVSINENKVPTSFIIPTKSNFKSSKIQNKPNKGIIETNKKKNIKSTAKISDSPKRPTLRSAKNRETNQSEQYSSALQLRRSKRKRQNSQLSEFYFPSLIKKSRKKSN